MSIHRAAGVLLHITSLPGQFGCGDMGKEARKFADFLFNAGQKYWQVLPLNPTAKDKGYSPYSSNSSVAGNTLLISPEMLVEKGFLTPADLRGNRIPESPRADFEAAEKIKGKLFEKAYRNFISARNRKERETFRAFCKKEKGWLDVFALYSVLKKLQQGKPWFEWPDKFKDRRPGALRKIRDDHFDEVEKTRWLQYVFFSQWAELKAYCSKKGISLFGDLPFYVSHDSADVWANPEIFSLDKKRQPVFVAGVPPDYFNDDGQLWGMPVFRWDVLKRNNYNWWIQRLRKNMELVDLLRLDHFRAFADYWAVPAKDHTARNGKWMKGPGDDFFQIVRKKLGALPFVAEDLGDINKPVHALREKFNFPGMKVLHFAFAENMPSSEYIPHNYTSNFVVYSGTHDNNTTVGWFSKDITGTERENLKRYFGLQQISSRNIHLQIIRTAYASVAVIAIIPVQDLLGLDEKARFNAPATVQNNWVWRMPRGAPGKEIQQWLKGQTEIFSR